jgi:hypothetical protein
MTKTTLGTIHDQTDFSQVLVLNLQSLPGNGHVPFSHPDGWIFQQPAQASCVTQQLGSTRDLPCNAAQAHRSALEDPNDQPYKIANLGDSLSRSQFPNPQKPGIIEVVGRYRITLFLKRSRKTNFSGESLPITYSVGEMSGS